MAAWDIGDGFIGVVEPLLASLCYYTILPTFRNDARQHIIRNNPVCVNLFKIKVITWMEPIGTMVTLSDEEKALCWKIRPPFESPYRRPVTFRLRRRDLNSWPCMLFKKSSVQNITSSEVFLTYRHVSTSQTLLTSPGTSRRVLFGTMQGPTRTTSKSRRHTSLGSILTLNSTIFLRIAKV